MKARLNDTCRAQKVVEQSLKLLIVALTDLDESKSEEWMMGCKQGRRGLLVD